VQNTRTFWLVNKDKLPTYLFSLSVKDSEHRVRVIAPVLLKSWLPATSQTL